MSCIFSCYANSDPRSTLCGGCVMLSRVMFGGISFMVFVMDLLLMRVPFVRLLLCIKNNMRNTWKRLKLRWNRIGNHLFVRSCHLVWCLSLSFIPAVLLIHSLSQDLLCLLTYHWSHSCSSTHSFCISYPVDLLEVREGIMSFSSIIESDLRDLAAEVKRKGLISLNESLISSWDKEGCREWNWNSSCFGEETSFKYCGYYWKKWLVEEDAEYRLCDSFYWLFE